MVDAMPAALLILLPWALISSAVAALIGWRAHRRGLGCWRLALAFAAVPGGAVILLGYAIASAWVMYGWITSGDFNEQLARAMPWMLISAAVSVFLGALLAARLLLVGVLDLAGVHAREAAENDALRRDLRALARLRGGR